MNENHFLEESPSPDPAAIAAAMGERYPWYESILEAAPGFERDWKHYGKKYGWKLKVHDGAKALIELSVTTKGLLVSVAAREAELQALRENPATAAALDCFMPPGKPKAGWGLRLQILDAEACRRAVAIVEAAVAIRLKD